MYYFIIYNHYDKGKTHNQGYAKLAPLDKVFKWGLPRGTNYSTGVYKAIDTYYEFSLPEERGNLSYGVKGLLLLYRDVWRRRVKPRNPYIEVVLEKTALLPKMVYVNSHRIHYIFAVRLFYFTTISLDNSYAN